MKAELNLPEFQDSMHARQVVWSDTFVFGTTLLGDPSRADALLEDVVSEMAIHPYSFPLIDWPDKRMALVSTTDLSIGIFFRVLPNDIAVELLWLTIKSKALQKAA